MVENQAFKLPFLCQLYLKATQQMLKQSFTLWKYPASKKIELECYATSGELMDQETVLNGC